MSDGPYSEIDALRGLARSEVARVRTAIPAIVKAYDHATQRATVQIAVRHAYRGDDGEIVQAQHALIAGRPVLSMGSSSGDYALTFPLSKGDEVLLLVMERSIDEYLATDTDDAVPRSLRRFDLTDSVVMPAFIRTTVPSAARDASAMVIRGDEIKLGSATATKAVALGDDVDSRLSALKTALNTWVPVPGDGGTALKTLLTALFGTGWPASVKASKVKAE